MSLANVQKLAAQTIQAVDSGKNLSDELQSIFAQQSELSPQDKGMLQDIAYGVQRFSGSLKFILNQMLNKPIDNQELNNLLLVALYQLNYTRNAPHAVVNEAVNHIARIQRGQYRSFANAILRRFLREREKFNNQLKSLKNNHVAKYNLPEWLVAYLQNHYPKHWHNIVTAFQVHPPLTLRVNRRKMNAEQYLIELQNKGLEAKILDEFAIRLNEAVPVSQLPLFEQGFVSVQDFGAQYAIELLQPQNGERILDACAAPGGKTGHLLEYADCAVTALDIDRNRLAKVASNLQRLDFKAVLHVAPAENLNEWYDGQPFDAVLADVPCTASGTIKRNPDIKWLRRPSDALKTARQQEAMLDQLWSVLKSGGRMLLATCSIFEEENQQQCQRFLSRHQDAVLKEEKILLPNEKQDGFYYALIFKK